MVLIKSDTSSLLWKTTAELGNTRPYGIASSPDGKTLYVGCVGNGSNGSLLAVDIDTKAVTTLDSGLSWMRHGIDVDSAGNIYYATGPSDNISAGLATCWRIGPGGGAPTSLFTDDAIASLTIWQDEIYYVWEWTAAEDRRRIAKRALNGTVIYRVTGFSPGAAPTEQFSQLHGIVNSTTYHFVANTDSGIGSWFARNDTGFYVAPQNIDGAGIASVFQGATRWTDDEAYLLGVNGGLVEIDVEGRSQTRSFFVTGLNNPADGGGNGFGDIHVTSLGRCFVSRGGWRGSEAAIPARDIPVGTDIGIYEVITTLRGGWLVGAVGFG